MKEVVQLSTTKDLNVVVVPSDDALATSSFRESGSVHKAYRLGLVPSDPPAAILNTMRHPAII